MRRVQIEEPTLAPAIAARLRRNDAGLVPAVVQDAATGDVLMMAWMDDVALARTLATRRATYWSRSRQEYWVKGETSGHTQHVCSVRLDCDGDTLLLRVDQVDGACHLGMPIYDGQQMDDGICASADCLQHNNGIEEAFSGE